MDKLTMHSVNKVDENIKKIGALFPNALTEVIKGYTEDGTAIIEQAIDFDVLKQELSNVVVEGPEERYQFTWPDKKKSILLANSPIAKTLRPCRGESVDFDHTENLYIEGDNLDVLKLLQETYLGKVKMIYIDPPYNTGNDFVYEDDFAQDTHEYLANSGQYDEEGNRLVQNTESNGRFHTDWLNMMYPRLKLAKDLLTDDGVIFISIDDNEVENIVKICNEIFGASNCISKIVVKNNPRGRQSDPFVATVHEYLVCYAKNKNQCVINGKPLSVEQRQGFNLKDSSKGSYRLLGLRQRGSASLREERPEMYFPIYVNPSTQELSLQMKEGWCCVVPQKSDGRDGRWMWGKDKCRNEIDRLVAKKVERRGEYDIFVKDYLITENRERTRKFKTIWDDKNYNNQNGTQEVKRILGGNYMSFPKSRFLLQNICTMGSIDNDIILDFFSGSATTAHAVMQLNAEDGGNRKFIMVQLPEETDEKSEAFKAGYKNICAIGKERIRRAGKKIKEDNKDKGDIENLDVGFRVLKVDSTNMQDVYYRPAEYKQDEILLFADNIKPDRTPEDLLFQVMLDLGVLLSSKIEETLIAGKEVFNVAEGYLMACFDSDVTSEVITEIAKKQPYYAVFRDSSIASDSVAANFEQIFATYSPTTVRKVL
ncbi:N6 adenine-specific DNA methyltransferase, D21 class [Syntrophomonas zehnderi OL-4]|uniref:N6 adenine-specific DNA methyltransferase, D21 class n=1 Tax=Syntrophomonas zehnderi OL-4 TaxID=690567 RepID=A0A0E4G8N3_9FIRM|nr:site-specific DNA-methyltransferase [Syntrophomonas zehnderi]CFW96117.1 N6 adenine-specific DNA methyltransferase, D21 class [Syntrophomonas zehnderi OL-4]